MCSFSNGFKYGHVDIINHKDAPPRNNFKTLVQFSRVEGIEVKCSDVLLYRIMELLLI